jgi:hypothetical protein
MNRRKLWPALLLLICGYAITASCQLEPIITDFRPLTSFTWTNRQANTYCDLEWMGNLEHEWVPCGLNLQATQTVTSIDMDAFQAALAQIDFLFRNAPEGMFVGRFFRVVASEQPLQPRSFTNALRLVNVSTSVLTSVTLGLKQGGASVPLTNFPSVVQMATTDLVRVWSPYPLPTPDVIVPMGNIGDIQDGWYASYDHDGSNRVFQLQVMPFGPVEKNILLTISNNSATVECEWLRLTQTRPY